MCFGFWIAGIIVGLALIVINGIIIKGKNIVIKILLALLCISVTALGTLTAFKMNAKSDGADMETVYVSDVSKVVINEKENLYDYILYFIWDNNSYSKKVDGSVIKSIYQDGSFQKCEIETTGWEMVTETTSTTATTKEDK